MRRGSLRIGAVLVLGVAAACSSPSASPSPTAPESAAGLTTGSVRIGESECTTDLAQTLPAGPTEITVVNDSQDSRHVGIWRIDDESTFDDVTFHVDNEVRRAEAGEPGEGHPSFLSEGEGVSVAGDGSAPLREVTRAGTYVVLCVRADGEDLRIFQALGPIQVE
jgi:hypothetical protein